MDPHEIAAVVSAFIIAQRQMLLILEALLHDNKRKTHIPADARHRIRQLTYFCMIHASDLVCRESTRMDRRCFAIFCHVGRDSLPIFQHGVDVVLRLYDELFAIPQPITRGCTDMRWQCFEAQNFRTQRTKVRRKMWFQNMKIKLIGLDSVVALILIIILFVWHDFKC
uniref:V-SNARE coiled-coil homology domain-containing protein n=1 Tax=Cucumis melo TaxID=3656 RepID=A0A9I9ELW0_CUCME